MSDKNFKFISSDRLIEYPDAISFMEHQVDLIKKNVEPETIWFLEHPSLYTAGTSADEKDLIDKTRFPVYQTGRGGQYTYHGPGQLVCYLMVNIQERKIGIREYVKFLENMVIEALAHFGIKGELREDRIGVWVCHGQNEDKIAAIGVRVRKGVTFHGLAINLDPDLSAFNGIIPCGIQTYGVTSMSKLGIHIRRSVLETILKDIFLKILTI